MRVSKSQRSLFSLSMGLGRPTANSLCSAAVEFGFDATVERTDRGYSAKMGGASKLPDDIWIEWNGERYGSAWKQANSYARRSLQDFAEDVVSQLSEKIRVALLADHHVSQLLSLGVVSDAVVRALSADGWIE